MPEQSIGTIRGMQALELALNGKLTRHAGLRLVKDLSNTVMNRQGIAGYTLENMERVVKTAIARNLTPMAIDAMTNEEAWKQKTGLPQGWFLATGKNEKNVKLGTLNIELGKGKNSRGKVDMDFDKSATLFTGGGGGGFMGAFFENMIAGFPINSVSGADIKIEYDRQGITSKIIDALAPEIKAISQDVFNVGKGTLTVTDKAFDLATMSNSVYSISEGSLKNLPTRLGEKQEARAKSKVEKDLKKPLEAEVDVVLDPVVALVIGLSEIFHKLMALLLLETVKHGEGSEKGVSWYLFEYLSAWVFWKLDVKKLLRQFNIKKDNSKDLFTVRGRVVMKMDNNTDLATGNFSMGSVALEVNVNIATGLHTGLDTSIYLEELNLFTSATRAAFFKEMAELQKDQNLFATNMKAIIG